MFFLCLYFNVNITKMQCVEWHMLKCFYDAFRCSVCDFKALTS